MSVQIRSGSTSDVADVDANKALKVNTPTVLSQAGYAVIAGESHDGSTGEARLVRAVRVSTDGRLRTGIDSLYWQDTFNHTIQDTGVYQHVTSTATLAMTGGFLVFNSGNSVASGAVARVQTFRTFPLNAHASIDLGFRLRFALAAQANNVCEFGLGFAATTATPTDGVYFKLTSGGSLVGVVNINGTEITTSAMPAFTPNNVDYYRIVIDQDRAEFFINGELQGVIVCPLTASAVSFARALPLLMRCYNSAATSSAQRMEVADVSVLSKDINLNRLLPTVQAGMCQNSINVPRGATAGFTANYANSAAPASATLSNTAAGYTTLGGQWQFAAVAGAETDYALFGYQVPAAAANAANKNLYIRGIRIETFNMGAAVATTPHLLQWALGVGSSAVSLATADSATAGTRAPRRIPLGVQSLPVAAAIGAAATPIDVNFDAPVMVEAGTFAHIILKMPVATATGSQIIRGTATINGYWE
jgi:hypothetical protein